MTLSSLHVSTKNQGARSALVADFFFEPLY